MQNKILEIRLSKAKEEIVREKDIVASLTATLKEMSLEVNELKGVMNIHYGNVTNQITGSTDLLNGFISSQNAQIIR